MFAYWGATGALPKLTLDFAHVAATQPARCTFSLSSSNELIEQYGFLGDALFEVPTFRNRLLAFVDVGALAKLRSALKKRLHGDRTEAFISLLSHVWSPLIAPTIRQAGVRHIVVVHDAAAHPGDPYGLVHRWCLREAVAADHVVTLSAFVARQLTARLGIPTEKISTLFHPDIRYGAASARTDNAAGPLRILFIGRLLPYKGLALLMEAVESLRRDGVPLTLGVFGRGPIEISLRERLSRLDAEVVNRWLDHDEFGAIFSRHDLVVAAHTEGSQSGIVAAALGAGVPVVVTPVGGLVEQVVPGVTGIVAESVSSRAVAEAIRKIAADRMLLARLRDDIAATRGERSPERFFDAICRIALDQTARRC
jgi:glycosyltransferase involved in cell wall biosynthesis